MVSSPELPDYYGTVADDMVAFCGRDKARVWMDLGSGKGDVGLELVQRLPGCVMILVDPDMDAVEQGLERACQRGLEGRVVAIQAAAEGIPMPAETLDVVVSRGSFYFWKDRVAGLREVRRILRPGGKAMIGGGLGSGYPRWARQEFIRRKRQSLEGKPQEAARFFEARRPETFHRLAVEAGWSGFDVVGEGGLGPERQDAGIGIWLRMTRKEESG